MPIDKEQRLKEAYYEYGEARCQGCNDTVDLSEADDINEAVEVWNDHVRAVHRDKED